MPDSIDKSKVMAALDFLMSDRSKSVVEGHEHLAMELEYVKTALQDVPSEEIINYPRQSRGVEWEPLKAV